MRVKLPTTIGIAFALTACGRCEPQAKPEPSFRLKSSPPLVDDTSREQALAMLVRHQVESGSRLYEKPIKKLVDAVCEDDATRERLLAFLMSATREQLADTALVKCRGRVAGKIRPFDPGSAALGLLRTGDSRMRAVAHDIICAMCTEQNAPCLCEGRACDPEDYSTAIPQMHEKLVCGALIIDGVSYPWGQPVRRIYDRIW